MSRDISLIIGSGFSIPYGLPKVSDIDSILTNEQIQIGKFSNGFYYKQEHFEKIQISEHLRERGYLETKVYIEFIRNLYQHEKIRFSNYNYEDLSYSLECLFRYNQNNINKVFFDHIYELSKSIEGFEEGFNHSRESFFATCKKLVKNIVKNEIINPQLLQPSLTTSISTLLTSNRINGLITTNYDLVLETLLENHGIAYQDGFEFDCTDNLHRFNPSFELDNLIKLVKIHGSVNWYLLLGSDRRGNFYAKRVAGETIESDCIFIKTDLARIDIVDQAILIGTENKLKDYNLDIYSKLKCKTSDILEETKKLIVTGFGFNDYGLTAQIVAWKFNYPDRKMIVVDPNASKISRTNWGLNRLINNFPNEVQLINQNFESCTAKDLLT